MRGSFSVGSASCVRGVEVDHEMQLSYLIGFRPRHARQEQLWVCQSVGGKKNLDEYLAILQRVHNCTFVAFVAIMGDEKGYGGNMSEVSSR